MLRCRSLSHGRHLAGGWRSIIHEQELVLKVSKSRWEKFVMDASRVGPEQSLYELCHRLLLATGASQPPATPMKGVREREIEIKLDYDYEDIFLLGFSVSIAT